MVIDNILTTSKNKHYAQKYLNFIQSCTKNEVEGYTENHHILPKSLFPEYAKDEWNLVRLTARQHFIAHVLLAKAFGGTMWHAVNMMTHCDEGGKRNYRVSSRIYDTMKVEMSKQLSIKMAGEANPMYGTSRKGEANPMYGKTHSVETKAKQSAKRIEYFSNPENVLSGERNGMYGKNHSEITRDKMSESHMGELNHNFGKPQSDEVKRKLSEAMSGRNISEEHKNKISAANLGKLKPQHMKDALRDARKGYKRINKIEGFFWSKPEDLHKYFLRDGKYYDYSA